MSKVSGRQQIVDAPPLFPSIILQIIRKMLIYRHSIIFLAITSEKLKIIVRVQKFFNNILPIYRTPLLTIQIYHPAGPISPQIHQERQVERFLFPKLLLPGKMQCCSYFELAADAARRKHFYLHLQIHITITLTTSPHHNIITSSSQYYHPYITMNILPSLYISPSPSQYHNMTANQKSPPPHPSLQ